MTKFISLYVLLHGLLPITSLLRDQCKNPIDIIYILDSSGSLIRYYGNEKEILKTLVAISGITNNGPHASVVTFSTRVIISIKFNDHTNVSTFNNAVDHIPLLGKLTRIDKALHVARDEFLNLANGAREGIPKVLILITDGSQTYMQDSKDPVVIAEEIRKEGIPIFTIGIGDEIDRVELELISGGKDKSFTIASFNESLGNQLLERVRNVTCNVAVSTTALPSTTMARIITTGPTTSSSTTPKPPKRVTTATPSITMTTPCVTREKPRCKAVNGCGVGNVYINIFRGGSGPNYVVQGSKLSQPRGRKVNINGCSNNHLRDILTKMAKSLQAEQKKPIDTLIKELERCSVTNKVSEESKTASIQKRQPNARKKRKKRSFDSTNEGLPQLKRLKKLANLAGCKLFMAALRNLGILRNITEIIKKQQNAVTIFCPTDAAYTEIFNKVNTASEKTNILLHHIATKYDEHGTVYQTFLSGRQVVLKSSKKDNKVSWKANNAGVMFSFDDGRHNEIIILNSVITRDESRRTT